ncbi:GNAT family N-acetyltransferase [Echinicola strongylocentroti]|uniref:GNAT family N-acetyltransferase n=1 Tax=Echinicola strongylocentroti TaxID=1795355 RepID=A0A2Z4INM1_9BACT|nr:GNAT family N-acetyltransferase [Echinicola strongylocentroti]AWW32359.1 GNAT family N-acetyltransferase [Echinicola strongylocentroti]
MIVKNDNIGKGGVFIALEDEEEAGRMTYTSAGDHKLIIDHTEVNPDYKGQGVGKLILMNLVDYARQNNYQVIPLCPFAKSVFSKEQKIRDVLFQ